MSISDNIGGVLSCWEASKRPKWCSRCSLVGWLRRDNRRPGIFWRNPRLPRTRSSSLPEIIQFKKEEEIHSRIKAKLPSPTPRTPSRFMIWGTQKKTVGTNPEQRRKRSKLRRQKRKEDGPPKGHYRAYEEIWLSYGGTSDIDYFRSAAAAAARDRACPWRGPSGTGTALPAGGGGAGMYDGKHGFKKLIQ